MERPIIFTAPMIRAILAGNKSQTRRVLKSQPTQFRGGVHPQRVAKHAAPYIDAYCGAKKTPTNPRGMSAEWHWWTEDDRLGPKVGRCPFGTVGDLLWVREAWRMRARLGTEYCVQYRADCDAAGNPGESIAIEVWPDEVTPHYDAMIGEPDRWRPSIHMPRWACRIALEITNIRVERVQDIDEAGARREGIDDISRTSRRDSAENLYCSAFADLWDSINQKRGYSWMSNPWVWVLEFRAHKISHGAKRPKND